MATNSQIVKRPVKGYFEDGDVTLITSTSDQTGTPRFKAVAHGLINGDDIQMIDMGAATGISDPDANPKYYLDIIDNAGDLPDGGNGVTTAGVDDFEFTADNFNYAGDAVGMYAKQKLESVFIAAFNPIIYRFWRSDDKITAISNNGGKVRAVFDTFASGLFPSGREVFIRDNYNHDKIFTVNTASGSPATVDFNEDFILARDFAQSIINAVNVDYTLEVTVFDLDDVEITTKPYIYHSPQNGRILVDVHKILSALMDFKSKIRLNTKNPTSGEVMAEFGRFQGFYIKTLEKFTGSSESVVTDKAKFQGFAIAATLDPGSKYGGNMAEFVPNTTRNINAPFLQKLKRPTVWRDFPWTICFLQSNLSSLVAEIEWRDSQDAVLLTRSATAAQGRYLGRYTPSIDDMPATAVTANVHLEQSGTKVTEELICDIEDACPNPIMIEWVNSVGGDSYWLFDFNILRTVSAEGKVEIEVPITDLQNQPIWKQYLGSDRDVEIRGTARGVSADNFEGMSGF